MKAVLAISIWLFLGITGVVSQHDDHGHDHSHENGHDHQEEHAGGCGVDHGHDDEYDPGAVAFHHISDQNIFSIGPWFINLPCILYAPEQGWSVFSSKKFHVHGHHGDGDKAYDRYVMHSGIVMRVKDDGFPMGEVDVSGFMAKKEFVGEAEMDRYYVCANDELYLLDQESAIDGGLFNRGITSFYDFSLTKNVVTMILVAILLGWMFISIAKRYRKREGMAPKGLQSFMEPIYLFIRDDVAKSVIGPKYERYTPFLMAIFFFILALNLIGQVPFFGNPNVTGSLAVTFVLAVFTFLVVNLNGNKYYWEHVLWMPGVPPLIKVLVLTPVEFVGLFLKPLTLMVRLFGNITAGHVVILSFIGLTFIFGNMGQNVTGGFLGAIVGVLMGTFMMAIELLVAFLQAFIFTILSASYIGAAVVDEDH